MVLQKLLLLGLAGALGTLARYGLSGLVARFSGSSFPWPTACVNLVGCLLFGILWSVTESQLSSISSEIRPIVLIGFMGAFTTFSTFVFETHGLMQNSLWMMAAGNLMLQNVIGIVALMLGMAIGRLI